MVINKFYIYLFLSLFIILSVSPLVLATHNQATYEYLIGNQFLEEFGPVVSMARNGDTIELKGGGMFTLNPRTVTGNGTLIHRDVEGNIIGKGKWKAVKLLSFQKYGIGIPQGLPENYEGGRALIKVILEPENFNKTFEGTLKVTCIIGNKIPKRAKEGIELAVREAKINFREEISGGTLFIRNL